MRVERVTVEILKELETLTDTKGRYIFHLARMYTHHARRRRKKLIVVVE